MNWKDSFPKEKIYYETDNGILYNTDIIKIIKTFPLNTIDLIITDPPYGVNFYNNKFFNDKKNYVLNLILNYFLSYSKKILKEGSHLYIFVPTLEIDKWVSGVKRYLNFNNLLSVQSHNTNLYIKNNFSFDLQLIIYASKGKAKRLNKVDFIPTSKSWLNDKRNKKKNPYTYKYPSFITNVKANEKFNANKKRSHPNQKSLELTKFLINLSSNENDIVMDLFAGSGTTLIGAEQLNRKWIGIEKDINYCQIIKENLIKLKKS